jgi:FkbM family methyltransferase
MSYLNLEWVKENFNNANFVFFEVGTAYIDTSMQVRSLMPNATIYAFEAANHWHESNEPAAIEKQIHYIKSAVSDIDGEVLLHPSTTQYGEPHPWSSSVFELYRGPGCFTHGKEYGEPYLVQSVRLETFCKQHNVCPDVIHIDVEGAELKVFQNMGEFKPKAIWAEVGAFGHYATGTSYEEFDSYITSIGYRLVFKTDNDALYCLTTVETTPYIPINEL